MTIQATTVVSFNSGSSDTEYIFNLALDDTLNLDNDGEVKSSFSPSDSIYLQVNKSDNVDITGIEVTSGSIRSTGSDEREYSVSNLFTTRGDSDDTDEFVLEHIPGDCSVSFIGKNGSVEKSLTPIKQFKFIPDRRKTPFIAKFDYTYEVLTYKFTAPTMDLDEDESFELAVVFYINVR
jgi:hypothetical protein